MLFFILTLQWDTGFFIGNKKILTNHHVISDATSIRLERNGQPGKSLPIIFPQICIILFNSTTRPSGNFAGTVLFKSELCDLALVTVDNDSFWNKLPQIEFDDNIPRLGDSVLAVGIVLCALYDLCGMHLT